MDEKSLNAVFNSLRDRVYQRSFNLRKTFRELDSVGKGAIPIDEFAAEMGRSFSLSALELKCLKVLLDEADFRRDGVIDFREFCEMLKMRDYDSDAVISDAQRKRLAGPGVLDPRMQKMMKENETMPIRVQGGVPTNELGHMNIECPFGVLGDSERMDAVIAAFFTHKTDTLRVVFRSHDADRDGWLTPQEFRNGMKEVDRYVFDDEIDNLLEAIFAARKAKRTVSSKHAQHINIEDFVGGLGREYLKKKAHRSNAHANPFVWNVPEPPRTAGAGMASGRRGVMAGGASPRGTMPAELESPRSRKPFRTSGATRASELRQAENRVKLADLTLKRREDKFYAAALDEHRRTLQSGGSGTPRLPQIGSARGTR